MNIVKWPNKILSTKTKEITKFNENIIKLASDMHDTMKKAKGIGLAANQIGISISLLVVHITGIEDKSEHTKWWYDKPMTLINPEIVYRKGKIQFKESCLSFPDKFGYVKRSMIIKVKGFDQKGQKLEIEADGLFAICLQHEIDHLNGIVFIDRMAKSQADIIKNQY